MKKNFILFLITLCMISLFGCSKDNSEVFPLTIPADVSSITDFKCVCSTGGETKFVIEGDKAVDLYSFVTEIWHQSEEIERDLTEQSYVYLVFQDGDPVYVYSQEQDASNTHFYGVFWICENDYLVFTGSPLTSFQKHYRLPKDSYKNILEMLNT